MTEAIQKYCLSLTELMIAGLRRQRSRNKKTDTKQPQTSMRDKAGSGGEARAVLHTVKRQHPLQDKSLLLPIPLFQAQAGSLVSV